MSFEKNNVAEKVKPLIGITMRYSSSGDFYLRKEYSQAVARFGGVPIHLPLLADQEFVEAAVSRLDGIVSPGSDSDVDPLMYGEEPRPQLGKVWRLRDQTDLFVIEAAAQRNLPLFGICYGMQILNAARGGALFQDIGSQVPEALQHQQGEPRERLSHRISIRENTRLADLSREPQALVNSHHHQAIKTIGQNLKIAAIASDGVIEAVEDSRADRFVIGVQWHPELNWDHDYLSQRLFAAFIEQAKRQLIERAA